jgi:hypothetical protein
VIAYFDDIGSTENARVVGTYARHCPATNCRLT